MAAFVAAAGYLVYRAIFAAMPDNQLSLNPGSGVSQNGYLTVRVEMSATTNPVDSVTFVVVPKTEDALFESVSYEGSLFDQDSDVVQLNGRVKISRNSTKPVQGPGLVATLKYKVNTASDNFILDIDPAESHFREMEDGRFVLSGAGGGTYKITPTSTTTPPTPQPTAPPSSTPAPTNPPAQPPSPGLGSGDLNNDGKINEADVAIMIQDWMTTSATSDVNGDGRVNLFDFSRLVKGWKE